MPVKKRKVKIETHQTGTKKIAEIIAEKLVIESSEDGLDLLGNMYYQGFDGIILHKHNISPDFFELKTGIAGEILQKFSNYNMRLVIIGNFEDINSKSLNDFIYESNNGRLVNFLETLSDGLEALSR